jgi:hypothetical protein
MFALSVHHSLYGNMRNLITVCVNDSVIKNNPFIKHIYVSARKLAEKTVPLLSQKPGLCEDTKNRYIYINQRHVSLIHTKTVNIRKSRFHSFEWD